MVVDLVFTEGPEVTEEPKVAMEHFMVESKSFITIITIIVVIEVDLEVGSQAMHLVACSLDYLLAHNGCLESLQLA